MIKKPVTFAIVILLAVFSTGYGQDSGLRGRVVDKDSKPVQGALVRLIIAKNSQTTDWGGNFFFEMKTLARIIQTGPVLTAISFCSGILSFNVSG